MCSNSSVRKFDVRKFQCAQIPVCANSMCAKWDYSSRSNSSLDFPSTITSQSSTAPKLYISIRSSTVISWRRRSIRAPHTSNSATPFDCVSLFHSGRSRSSRQEMIWSSINGCVRVARGAGRRAVDTPAPNRSPKRSWRRAFRYRTSRRSACTLRARGCGGLTKRARRSPRRHELAATPNTTESS